jgi:heme/copper-type cytochrome/quinol oxidase subunit 1
MYRPDLPFYTPCINPCRIYIYIHIDNHKILGLYYIYVSIILGVPGSLYSILLRLELYGSSNRIISPENQYFYSLSYTLHGILMIFYMVMPGMIGGLGNYMIPIYMGANEVGFPRTNGYSLLLLFPVSMSLVLTSGVTELPGGTGWTLYPPLSTTLTVPLHIYTTVQALVASGVSSLPGSMNFYSTITSMGVPGTGLGAMYLFPWSICMVFILLILMLPVLTGTMGTLVSDTHFNTVYMDPALGGDPVLYQHLFWFFGHPEVYVLIVPAFGVTSQILQVIAGSTVVYGGPSMVLAMSCISSVGSLV